MTQSKQSSTYINGLILDIEVVYDNLHELSYIVEIHPGIWYKLYYKTYRLEYDRIILGSHLYEYLNINKLDLSPEIERFLEFLKLKCDEVNYEGD